MSYIRSLMTVFALLLTTLGAIITTFALLLATLGAIVTADATGAWWLILIVVLLAFVSGMLIRQTKDADKKAEKTKRY